MGLGLDKQSTYGLLSDLSEVKVRSIINFLILNGYAQTTNSEYPVMTLSEMSRQILTGQTKVEMKTRIVKTEPVKTVVNNDVDYGLMTNLKDLRSTLAKQEHMPAYIIFTDAALVDMCKKRPKNPEEFLLVSGVGKAKQHKYGQKFIELITEYDMTNIS
jgi:ATP-dependent DNA helicase RecQ